MVLENNNNQQSFPGGLTDRFDAYWQEQNKWKLINGGCEIQADLNMTLADLQTKARPYYENLAKMIRVSTEKNDKRHRPLEQIWVEKIAEGATHVGIIDGAFRFYKGEDVLPDDNVPLKISALPPILQFRDVEKQQVKDRMTEMRRKMREGMGGGILASAGTDSVTDGVSDVS